MSCADLFLALIAVLFPPIAVWIKSGICTGDSLINILLCMLGYIPGLLHAWYIIARNPEVEYDYEPVGDAENGNQRVTYYYVSHEPASGARRTYGTAAPPAAPGQGQRLGQPRPKKPQPQQQPQRQGGTAPAASRAQQPPALSQAAGPSASASEDEGAAPPSYNEVIRGDNKIQRDN